MKAAYVYGPEAMDIRDIPTPIPGRGEALIEIIYAGVCGSDITMYRGQHPTARLPVVLGHEIFGIVREISGGTECVGRFDSADRASGVNGANGACGVNGTDGANGAGGVKGTDGANGAGGVNGTEDANGIRVGDKVAAEPLLSCGVCEACMQGFGNVCGKLRIIGLHENGAYAQFVKVGVGKLVKIKTGIPDKLAALAEPFGVAYHVCMRGNLRGGEDALIIGAGPIGNIVAVMARAFGANVVVSEPNHIRRATAEKLGFATYDPVGGDEGTLLSAASGGAGFDVVFEASGSKAGILSTTRLCKIHGVIVPLALASAPVDFVLGQVSFKEQTVVGTRVYPFLHYKRGVEMLERLYADGVQLDPLVSDILPLHEAQRAVDMMINGENACKILLDARA